MWILLTENDTVQPGDRRLHSTDGSHLTLRELTGWDAVEHVIDTEIPADSTQALKCLVRMLRAKTAPTDP